MPYVCAVMLQRYVVRSCAYYIAISQERVLQAHFDQPANCSRLLGVCNQGFSIHRANEFSYLCAIDYDF